MQNLSIYLIEKDSTTLQLLRMYLKELDYVNIVGEGEDLNSNYSNILKSMPEVVIANVSDDFEKNYEII